MRLLITAAAFGLLAAGATTTLAAESAGDAYAACVIGKAAVLMHHSADIDTAAAVAWQECEPLNSGIDDEEGEGIADFVYVTLEKLAS
jgi:hypothetical protein